MGLFDHSPFSKKKYVRVPNAVGVVQSFVLRCFFLGFFIASDRLVRLQDDMDLL
jgi:hypothetical protein